MIVLFAVQVPDVNAVFLKIYCPLIAVQVPDENTALLSERVQPDRSVQSQLLSSGQLTGIKLLSSIIFVFEYTFSNCTPKVCLLFAVRYSTGEEWYLLPLL